METVEDVIVRRLTAERIEELKKLIRETQETHRFREIHIYHSNTLDFVHWQSGRTFSEMEVRGLMCMGNPHYENV